MFRCHHNLRWHPECRHDMVIIDPPIHFIQEIVQTQRSATTHPLGVEPMNPVPQPRYDPSSPCPSIRQAHHTETSIRFEQPIGFVKHLADVSWREQIQDVVRDKRSKELAGKSTLSEPSVSRTSARPANGSSRFRMRSTIVELESTPRYRPVVGR